MAKTQFFEVKLGPVVGGGQTMADVVLADGAVKKAFIWGGLPGETVRFRVTKKRAGIIEGVVTEVLQSAPERVAPRDELAYLATSPWQIYDWQFELQTKAELIRQAFVDHKITIEAPAIQTDHQQYYYRNKMEFTWWWDNDTQRVELAHYQRGAKGKVITDGSSLARPEINQTARRIRDLINAKNWQARQLKTVLLRANQAGQVVAQLYVTDEQLAFSETEFANLNIAGLELIYSNPKSPASVIAKRLQVFGQMRLCDELSGLEFSYPAESFFQINLPVYQMALDQISVSLLDERPVVDLYSGVGTIGLSVAGERQLKLVEINQSAVAEMRQNLLKLGRDISEAILAPAEQALDYITSDCQLIVDPPRAGLHQKVIEQILKNRPQRVIYLSCNVATQARDVALLAEAYRITAVAGFNFFPKTPHIENLVILDLK